MSSFTRIKTQFDTFSGNLSKISESLSKLPIVGKEGPIHTLAEGLAYKTILPKVQKEQDELDIRQRELDEEVTKNIIEAKLNNDQERVQRLFKVSGQDSITSVEAILENAPSNRKVLAAAGELALLTTFGYKGALPGTATGKFVPRYIAKFATQVKRAKQMAKVADASRGMQIFQKVIKPVLREAGIGSAFFSLMKAQEEDATTQDIVKAGELGAVFGVAFMGVLIGIGKGISAAAPPVKKAFNSLIRSLEKAEASKLPLTESQIDRTLSFIGSKKTIKQFTAHSLLKGVQATRQFKARLIDRFSPIQRVQGLIEELKGSPLTESEKVYRDARLLQSVSDRAAENKIVTFLDTLRPYDDVRNESKAYLAQLDFIDRVKLGQKVPSGETKKELQDGLRRIIEEIGPENMQKVGKVRQIMRDYHTKLLQERVDAGLVSKELMGTLLETHPTYIPHNVLLDIDREIVETVAGSLNVAKTDIMKAIGSIRKIEDPFISTIQRTPIATRIIEKNKLLNNLIQAQKEYKMLPGMKRISPMLEPASGFKAIDLFRNGARETWQVPADVAISIKNLDGVVMPKWFNLATIPQKLLKKGATTYNLSFALPNKFRDKQTAAITSQAFIEALAEKAAISPRTLHLTTKEIAKLYKDSGGYGASIFKEGESEIFKRFNRSGIAKLLTEKNPARIIESINDGLEQSTRLEVFRRALERGLSAKDAALAARDATIDFAKMGAWMKPLNQAIPFLNARVQGFVNLPRAFIRNPEVFARMQLYTAAYPTLGLYQHNRRYSSYSSISEYVKNKYWIVMIGETETKDKYTGNPITIPHFVTIPKGEGQTLVSGPIQFFLEKSDKIDFRKTSEMIADTLGSASPLEFQGFDQSNFFLTSISQFGPLATIPAGLGTNIHPFFGTPIIPEQRVDAPTELQFRKSTPETTKELANIMGIAPARLEFMLNSFGGLPQDIQTTADIVFGFFKDEDVLEGLREKSLSEEKEGILTKIPISRRFIREANEFYGPESEFRKEQKKEIEVELRGEQLKTQDKAEEIWKKMNKRKDFDDRLNYLNSLGEELTPEIKKKLMSFKSTRDTIEVLKKSDSIELRARYILLRLDEMKMGGVSLEDRIKFLDSLEEAKILNNNVKRLITVIKEQNVE